MAADGFGLLADGFRFRRRPFFVGYALFLINLDFADVRAVMREMGSAMMGTGEASSGRRALLSAEAAIANPLIQRIVECIHRSGTHRLITVSAGSFARNISNASRCQARAAMKRTITGVLLWISHTYRDSYKGRDLLFI